MRYLEIMPDLSAQLPVLNSDDCAKFDAAQIPSATSWLQDFDTKIRCNPTPDLKRSNQFIAHLCGTKRGALRCLGVVSDFELCAPFGCHVPGQPGTEVSRRLATVGSTGV